VGKQEAVSIRSKNAREGVSRIYHDSSVILFIPLSVWVIYACSIRGPYSGKVIGVAFAAGVLAHVLLVVGFGLFKPGVIGSAGLLIYPVLLGFAPIILAAIGSRFIKPELLRPVPVQ
jgi:hypothetical protein